MTVEIDDVVRSLEAEIRSTSTPTRAQHEKRYLKSDLEHYGASLPDLRRITKAVLEAEVPNDREATLKLADALWQRPVHELRMTAALALAERQALLTIGDLAFLERLLRESRTWALVDLLSPSVVGPLASRDPEVLSTLERWSRDPDFWLRRAALLAFLLPMRRNEPVFDTFAVVADPLLEDEEFFVRKAIGWVLRERTKRASGQVFEWLLPRRRRASRLTLREASKHLPEDQRAALLAG